MPGTPSYDTELSPSEEIAFNLWVNKQYPSKKVEDVTKDYDLRGAWKEINKGSVKFDERGHLPDTYKKPNHITFSNESKYHSKETPGGVWYSKPIEGKNTNSKTEQWHFQPSAHNIKTNGKENMVNYFKKFEPDVRLMFNEIKPQETPLYISRK
jgi:hypothetical protein